MAITPTETSQSTMRRRQFEFDESALERVVRLYVDEHIDMTPGFDTAEIRIELDAGQAVRCTVTIIETRED